MSNPSNQQFDTFCSSSYTFIPNKKHDFRKLKIPLIICLAPFHEKDKNSVKSVSFAYHFAPKCYRCKAISFPAINQQKKIDKQSKWICPICNSMNLFSFSYLKNHSNFDSCSPAFDFFCPPTNKKAPIVSNSKTTTKQPSFSYQNKSFLFVLELTTSTQHHSFFRESLKCIKNEIEKRNDGFVSIFIVNSHLYFPTIQKNTVYLSSTYEIDDTIFLPFKKLFFNLKNQKKMFLDFIDFIDKSVQNNSLKQDERTDIYLLDILQLIIKLLQNEKIKCIFLVSQIVKDNEDHSLYKSYKELIFSMIDKILPFDFFLIENMFSNHNFDVLREVVCIGNGYINFYNNSASQIQFFSKDFTQQINHLIFEKIYINAIVPPSLKVVEIRGCGVRTLNNSFTLMNMSSNDAIYYYIDFSSSEINNGECLNFQFQIAYHDSDGKKRIRIINHQMFSYEGLEMTTRQTDYSVLISGCINQAIDFAREEDVVEKAVDTMKSFNQIFNSDKNAKEFFQNQSQTLQINWFWDVLNSSMNILYFPLFWPFMLGKLPTDIQLLFSPLIYKIDLANLTFLGPFLLSSMIFEVGYYIATLSKNHIILFSTNTDENCIPENETYLKLKEKIQQMFPESKLEIIHSQIQSINDLKKHTLILR